MPRVFPWLIASLFFCTSLCCGYLLLQERNDAAQLKLDFGQAEKDSQRRLADLKSQLGQAKAAADAAAKQAAQAAAAPSSSGGGAGSAGGPAGVKIVHIGDILKEHPEYNGIYLKQIRRNVDRMYADGLATLNLSADQQTKLKDLLVQRQLSVTDAQGAAEAAGMAQGSKDWQNAIKDASQETEQPIKDLLGDNADNLLTQLQVRAGMQNQVQYNYAPDFADGGAPLSAAQQASLAQAMADANYAGKDTSTRPANYNEVDPSSNLSPHDDRIITNASAALTPAQVDLLKTAQSDQEQLNKIMRQYNPGNGRVMFVP